MRPGMKVISRSMYCIVPWSILWGTSILREGSLIRKKRAKIRKSNETLLRLTLALVMASAMARSTSSVKPFPRLKKVLGGSTMSRNRCVSACA